MTHPDHRALAALGLAEAPRDHPLTYPGAWPEESGLLDGDRLLPLTRLTFEDRVPVLAVGSNACPAQLRHKMREYGVTAPIPLVKAKVTGIEIGVSAHITGLGYVSASPFRAPGLTRELFLTWLRRDGRLPPAWRSTYALSRPAVPAPVRRCRRPWFEVLSRPEAGRFPPTLRWRA